MKRDSIRKHMTDVSFDIFTQSVFWLFPVEVQELWALKSFMKRF